MYQKKEHIKLRRLVKKILQTDARLKSYGKKRKVMAKRVPKFKHTNLSSNFCFFLDIGQKNGFCPKVLFSMLKLKITNFCFKTM
jgi:hypothetical protein